MAVSGTTRWASNSLTRRSESALIALYFALKEDEPVVWMLNPLDLNDLSYTKADKTPPRQFPIPWHDPDPSGRGKNPAFENLRGA
jgi:hypothetical protein